MNLYKPDIKLVLPCILKEIIKRENTSKCGNALSNALSTYFTLRKEKNILSNEKISLQVLPVWLENH